MLLLALLLAASPVTTREPLRVGETDVQLVRHDAGAGPFFLNLHDDENTSVEAGLELLDRRGGTLLELQHGGPRLVTFELHGKRFVFDPNRIFTHAGAEATLRKNGRFSREALAEVERFARAVLDPLKPSSGQPIIALHNNTPDLGFSIQGYAKGPDAKEAARVHVDPAADPNDFFLVLDAGLFEKLAARGFNVVLQRPDPTDDGSLSVYAAQQHLPYVNVEAQHGHRAEQAKMLEALVDVLGAK